MMILLFRVCITLALHTSFTLRFRFDSVAHSSSLIREGLETKHGKHLSAFWARNTKGSCHGMAWHDLHGMGSSLF
ncbi:uncharacterized protein B0J16DRAFT_30165 [Fusarium flagelliforme]|uniref:uncharacterized protein n=1 Tax=Fusarium flagelliforme TaxID=2675880 RepID=UPI001E8EC4D1|nr:uncharacterized protein B0J16DRAFT_30165 [Fusarium flagelliforme]KAH7197924.1 hypothetical protein B0J16DRAFT_30165 [Fusarium flagelliforme]